MFSNFFFLQFLEVREFSELVGYLAVRHVSKTQEEHKHCYLMQKFNYGCQ